MSITVYGPDTLYGTPPPVGGGGGGDGDVVGPASGTDNAIVRMDGATGKLVQNSTVTVSDTGNIATSGTVDGVDISAHAAAPFPHGGTLADLNTAISDANLDAAGSATGLLETGGPTALALGAVADGEFLKRVGTDIVGDAGGSGDVVGPGSATANALPRYSGTTGKLLKGSSVTVDDSGNIATPGNVDGVDVSTLPGLITTAQAAADAAADDAADVASDFATHAAAAFPHTGTLAELNTAISDANVDAAGTARPPNGSAGGHLGGTYPNPDVRSIRETGGPTSLVFGTIADGGFVKRSGSDLVGVAFGTTSGTVAQGSDSRFTDSRAPNGSASGDLGGSYPSPTVSQARGLRESGGTTLTMAGVTDGQFLKRNGSTIDSAAAMSNPMTTADDIIYGGASGVPTRMAVGAFGKSLRALASLGFSYIVEPTLESVFFRDFLDTGEGGFSSSASGAGAAVANTATGIVNDRCGIVSLTTGTTTTGRIGYYTTVTQVVLGAGGAYYDTQIQIPTLSDATDRFFCLIGCPDSPNGAGEPTDGIYFRYSDDANSGKFQCLSRQSSTETAVDSGITVVAGTWYRLEFILNTAANSISFKINNTVVATITTNIPTGDTQRTGIAYKIEKSAGTTARTLLADYVWFHKRLSRLAA